MADTVHTQRRVRGIDDVDSRRLKRGKYIWQRNNYRPEEPSHSRGALEVPEPLTLGAQYLTRCNSWGTLVRATRPALVCASPESIIRVKRSYFSGGSSHKEPNWSETFGSKSATPTVGWLKIKTAGHKIRIVRGIRDRSPQPSGVGQDVPYPLKIYYLCRRLVELYWLDAGGSCRTSPDNEYPGAAVKQASFSCCPPPPPPILYRLGWCRLATTL